ncbi:hypothetical protein SVAN01_03764 [Stagonosporopsis vannaccii]|nr:hypothetical protein SVAN01_03764 [Stagonosporopsis vannaccii]
MRRKVIISLFPLSSLFNPSFASSGSAAVSNANHVFNAIHSSMRQWGGSLNHNGMSLFLATVPEGTQLYHGTSKPDFIEGMQWLAFEPEHALIFAGPRGPPPHKGEGPHPPDGEQSAIEDVEDMRDGGDQKHHRPLPWNELGEEAKYEPPQSSYHDEHHEETYNDRHCDHRLPPSSSHHEYGHPSPDHERGPRKHREHGPPPPLPPGHIYKPYPPPPHEKRPLKDYKRPWDAQHRQPPSSDHHDDHPGRTLDKGNDSAKHNRPLSTPQHDQDHDHDRPREPIEFRSPRRPRKRQTQQPLLSPPQEERTGYLHTYAPVHDLHLLYIDGLSAGKTSNGTLDTQDLLLLNMTSDAPGGGPMGGEMARAEGLCALASSLWEGKVDGFIRLEGGFEIILCEFEKHLRRVDVVRVSRNEQGGDARNAKGKGRAGVMGGWSYLKAITSRYHGIGGGRVRVDYDNFVSVFQYDSIRTDGLWDNDVHSDVRMPRLTNVSPNTLASLRADVTTLILSKDWTAHDRTHDWQATADMLVARYSTPLHHLTSTPLYRTNKPALAAYLSPLLRPFIDASARNASLETTRCVAQHIPALHPPASTLPTPPASLPPFAHRALHAVATRLCDTLLTTLSIASSTTPHSEFDPMYATHGVELVKELVEWLRWTSWKECVGCQEEEVCFVPIWPMGSAEDHARPRCRGEEEVGGRSGYWGRMGRPRGRGGREGEKGEEE